MMHEGARLAYQRLSIDQQRNHCSATSPPRKRMQCDQNYRLITATQYSTRFRSLEIPRSGRRRKAVNSSTICVTVQVCSLANHDVDHIRSKVRYGPRYIPTFHETLVSTASEIREWSVEYGTAIDALVIVFFRQTKAQNVCIRAVTVEVSHSGHVISFHCTHSMRTKLSKACKLPQSEAHGKVLKAVALW